MVAELDHTNTSLNIPEHTGHVARGGDDLTVVDEAAATKVARVGAELPGAFQAVAVLAVEVVNRADVVKPTARDKVAGRRVGACHDPAGAKWDSVNFVGCVGVPNDKLAILGRGDEVTTVSRPVHGVDFGEMTPKGAPGAHHDAR